MWSIACVFHGQLHTFHFFRDYWKDIDRWRIRSTKHGVDKVTVVRPLFSRPTGSILQVGHDSMSRRLIVISRCYGNKTKLESFNNKGSSFVSPSVIKQLDIILRKIRRS